MSFQKGGSIALCIIVTSYTFSVLSSSLLRDGSHDLALRLRAGPGGSCAGRASHRKGPCRWLAASCGGSGSLGRSLCCGARSTLVDGLPHATGVGGSLARSSREVLVERDVFKVGEIQGAAGVVPVARHCGVCGGNLKAHVHVALVGAEFKKVVHVDEAETLCCCLD